MYFRLFSYIILLNSHIVIPVPITDWVNMKRSINLRRQNGSLFLMKELLCGLFLLAWVSGFGQLHISGDAQITIKAGTTVFSEGAAHVAKNDIRRSSNAKRMVAMSNAKFSASTKKQIQKRKHKPKVFVAKVDKAKTNAAKQPKPVQRFAIDLPKSDSALSHASDEKGKVTITAQNYYAIALCIFTSDGSSKITTESPHSEVSVSTKNTYYSYFSVRPPPAVM